MDKEASILCIVGDCDADVRLLVDVINGIPVFQISGEATLEPQLCPRVSPGPEFSSRDADEKLKIIVHQPEEPNFIGAMTVVCAVNSCQHWQKCNKLG